jgi:hypothetical protein
MSAIVTVNGQNSYFDCSSNGLGTSVTLGVTGLSGSHSYLWTIVDQPPNVGSGAQAVLSSATSSAPTFTPSNEGSYLVQCIVDQGTSVAQDITGVAFIRQLVSGERIPAANESIETDGLGSTEANAGWAVSTNSLWRRLDTLTGDPGVVVGIAHSNGLAVLTFVSPRGSSTIGSPAAANGVTYPGFDENNAFGNNSAVRTIGVIIGPVPPASGVGAAGDFMQIRVKGLITGIAYTGSPPTVFSPIYLTDSGLLTSACLSAGTHSRVVGSVAAINTTASTFDVFIDP